MYQNKFIVKNNLPCLCISSSFKSYAYPEYFTFDAWLCSSWSSILNDTLFVDFLNVSFACVFVLDVLFRLDKSKSIDLFLIFGCCCSGRFSKLWLKFFASECLLFLAETPRDAEDTDAWLLLGSSASYLLKNAC